MRRRDFMKVIAGGAALAWPCGAIAQQPERLRRIGVLMSLAETDPEAQPRLTAFQQGLQDLGWTDGRNVRIDYRWAADDANRARAYAAELVGLMPDVILANSIPVLAALQRATSSIPIVFVLVFDPVGSGFVASLAHPGGNITGFSHFEPTIGGKWLEVLKDAVPHITRVAVIHNPDESQSLGYLRVIEAAAPSVAVQVTAAGVRNATDIEHAIDVFARELNGGLVVLSGPTNTVHRQWITSLAAKYRLPAVYPFRYYATSGGLMSYGINTFSQFRQAASYVNRILKGEKPADLPVQAPTKYELVINLKTAKALGLEISSMLLARADEVIE